MSFFVHSHSLYFCLRRSYPSAVGGLLLLSLLLSTGCSTSRKMAEADREAHSLIAAAERKVFGQATGFSMATEWSERDAQEVDAEEILASREAANAIHLDLTNSIEIAYQHSRDFQTRRENLFLSALEVTRQQYELGPIFSARSELSIERAANGDRSGSVRNQVGLDWLLATGGRLGVSLSSDLFRFFTGDPRQTATTALTLNLVQPLLRGANREVVAERLTQAERNLIYEVRNFTEFQKEFSLQVVRNYYNILVQKDAVRNEYNAYSNLILARKRAEALARDRLPEFQVDQARQDELRARNRYIQAIERYRFLVDSFKRQLGLPPSLLVSFDDQPLLDLLEVGLPEIPFDEKNAYEIALGLRLDLLNEIDRYEDRQRRIRIAADGMLMDVSIQGGATWASDPPDNYSSFDADRIQGSLGLVVDWPLDRLRERNALRVALIEWQQQIRTLSLAFDSLRGDIRQTLRNLEEDAQTYIIQRRSVELANRRVDSANLLLQAGRAEIRDLLEAQAAQLQARNAVTQALVGYYLERYTLFRQMGILEVDEVGLWTRVLVENDPSGTPVQSMTTLDVSADLLTPDELFRSFEVSEE